jgi:hypothetical protein
MAATLPTEEDPCMYRYTKLRKNEIRLAKLLPGKFEDPIIIKLYSATQRGPDDPKYEALSYAWGSRANPSSIQIRDGGRMRGERAWSRLTGQKRSYVLSVAQSLEVALRFLRRRYRSRTLWIDAICIDQSNKDERSVEVLRMGDIYHWAERVVIWLGTAGPHVKDAFDLFHHIDCNYKLETSDFTIDITQRESSEEAPARYNMCYECHYSTTLKTGIEDLLNRAWFERLWIWQELCRARKAIVTYGDREILWNTLSTAINCIELQLRLCGTHSKQGINRELVRRINLISGLYFRAERFWKDGGDLGLYNLLSDTQYSKCEDPRDRIYAHLSMLWEGLRQRIRPDYEKSVSDVYTDSFLQSCAEYGELILLKLCGERSSTLSLPSWVPDLSVPRDVEPLGDGLAYSSGRSACEYSVESKSVLCVKGLQSATVATVSDRVAHDPDFKEVSSTLRRTVPANSSRLNYLAGGTVFDAYCSIVVCGNLAERYPDTADWPTLEEGRSLLSPLLLGREEIEDKHTKENEIQHPMEMQVDDQALYETLAVRYTAGRVFFTTAEGYIGLGSADIQAGDIVCVFLGLDMPIVLRAAGNDFFKVIGCCYVHGIIDGEALLGPLPTSWRIENRSAKTGATEMTFFVNSATKVRTQEDPRLTEFPPGWSSTEDPDTGELNFAEQGQGAWTWHDPRMTSEELIKHGVPIRTSRLV